MAFSADHPRAFLYSPNTCVHIPEQDTSFLETDVAEVQLAHDQVQTVPGEWAGGQDAAHVHGAPGLLAAPAPGQPPAVSPHVAPVPWTSLQWGLGAHPGSGLRGAPTCPTAAPGWREHRLSICSSAWTSGSLAGWGYK